MNWDKKGTAVQRQNETNSEARIMNASARSLRDHLSLVICLLAFFYGMTYGMLALRNAQATLATADFATGFIFAGFALWILKRPGMPLQRYGLIFTAMAFFYFLFLSEASRTSGYIWSILIPTASMLYLGAKVGAITSVTYLALLLGAYAWPAYYPSSAQIPVALFGRFVGAYIMSGAIAFVYERSRLRAEAVIRKEVQEKDRLFARLSEIQSAAENSNDIIVVKDLDLKVKATNAAFARITGHQAPEAMIGKTDAEIFGVSPDTEPIQTYMDDERRAQTLKRGEFILREEAVPAVDGSVRYVLTKKYPIFNHQDELIGTGNISTDITERKRSEEKLLAMNERLKATTVRANTMAAEARSANMAKSEFMASMSHEIRTPLNGVVGITELLLNTPLSENQRHYIELIHSSGSTLRTLINDILDFASIEARKFQFDAIDFDLRHLMTELAITMQRKTKAKGLELATVIALGTPTALHGDPARLQQVLHNLVENAIRYTEKGNIEITVDLTVRTDNVSADTDNATHEPAKQPSEGKVTLRFTVKDTGIGITASKHDQIFQRYTRMDGSYTRINSGSGLGLALSKQLVAMMNGQMGSENSDTNGAVFWFTIEMDAARQAIVPPTTLLPIESTPHKNNEIRVLVVEDNQTNQVVAHGILEQLGIASDIAENGMEAIDAVNARSYDLILMDIQMPIMNGIEATRTIREGPSTSRKTPIVAMTAYAMQGDRETCLHAGMNDYMTKPISSEGVAAMIQKWVHQPTAACHISPDLPIPKATSANPLEVWNRSGLLTRLRGSEVLARKIELSFLGEMPRQMDTLRSFLQDGCIDDAARQAHTIKGASSNIG